TAGVSQGDSVFFTNLNISSCDTGYVCGDSQARDVIFTNGSIIYCRQAFDTINYGAGAGTPANPISIENMSFVQLYRIFALNNQSSCLIKSNYAESIKALGEAGKNLGGSPTPIVFEGGQY